MNLRKAQASALSEGTTIDVISSLSRDADLPTSAHNESFQTSTVLGHKDSQMTIDGKVLNEKLNLKNPFTSTYYSCFSSAAICNPHSWRRFDWEWKGGAKDMRPNTERLWQKKELQTFLCRSVSSFPSKCTTHWAGKNGGGALGCVGTATRIQVQSFLWICLQNHEMSISASGQLWTQIKQKCNPLAHAAVCVCWPGNTHEWENNKFRKGRWTSPWNAISCCPSFCPRCLRFHIPFTRLLTLDLTASVSLPAADTPWCLSELTNPEDKGQS